MVARNDTDNSLRVERHKTDKELSEQRSVLQSDSDAVVQRAREKADAVLETARANADVALNSEAPAPNVKAAVTRERSREDKILEGERAVADEQLEVEREVRQKALRELLRLERDATDGHLLIERARADEALLSRDDFMAIVSHDLRGMLGGIAVSAALIVKDTAHSDSAGVIRRRADGIQKFTSRMSRLIGDLVDVASMESGKLKVTAQADDAGRIARESVEAFQADIETRGHTLSVEIADGPLPARFDPERVLQVLANLFGNAIKFTPYGGQIAFRVKRAPDGGVRFSVTDSGPGIDASKHQAVFNRFWQADEADRRGMGLGLYISRCIVEAHGGQISVESAPGKGSTFCFTLPAQ